MRSRTLDIALRAQDDGDTLEERDQGKSPKNEGESVEISWMVSECVMSSVKVLL
jgi:hypothetical protein